MHIYIGKKLPACTVSESLVRVHYICRDVKLQETELCKYIEVIIEEMVCFPSTHKVFLMWINENI